MVEGGGGGGGGVEVVVVVEGGGWRGGPGRGRWMQLLCEWEPGREATVVPAGSESSRTAPC